VRRGFQVVQLGPNAQLPQDQRFRVDSFGGGLDLRDAPEDLQPGSSPDMDDVLVTRGDRLARVAGVIQAEDLGRVPEQVLLHPGYHFSSALVFLAPPWVGVKSNVSTVWTNVGLPAGQYGYTDFAGILLLSCGVTGTYLKEPDKPDVSLIPGAPPALGLAAFAGRVVLGGTLVAGNMDLMSIGWSDATSDPKGWDPVQGAGSESMIGSMRRADRFQGFAMLGFELLAIVNRRSLWSAQPTGDVYEPLNIRPKLEDTGCTHASTVLPTEYGAVFLSDDGVRVFDGNQSLVISDQIAAELLPIDETAPYAASLDPKNRRYRLHTPTHTYIYDLSKKLWYRRPATYLGSVWFPAQGSPGPTWGTASGTWGAQSVAWWQLDPQEYAGSMYYVRGQLLGVEDESSFNDFGVPLTPRWFSRRELGEDPDTLMTAQAVHLTYESTAPAAVQVWLPSISGDYELVTTVVLPSTAGATGRYRVPFIHTGRGAGIGLQITSGTPLIRKASLVFQPTSIL